MSPFTDSQQKVLSIIPHFSGLFSIAGSSAILISVARDRTKWTKPYHRIMFAMCTFDVLSSIALGLSTWPIPRDSTTVFAPKGTGATCSAQAFFIQANIAGPIYNFVLSVYYLLRIKYHYHDRVIQRRIEPLLQAATIAFGVGTATICVSMGMFHDSSLWCWINAFPKGCDQSFKQDGESSSSLVPCTEGDNAEIFRWAFFFAPLWSAVFGTMICMGMIYHTVRAQEKRASRWLFGSQLINASNNAAAATAASSTQLATGKQTPLTETKTQTTVTASTTSFNASSSLRIKAVSMAGISKSHGLNEEDAGDNQDPEGIDDVFQGKSEIYTHPEKDDDDNDGGNDAVDGEDGDDDRNNNDNNNTKHNRDQIEEGDNQNKIFQNGSADHDDEIDDDEQSIGRSQRNRTRFDVSDQDEPHPERNKRSTLSRKRQRTLSNNRKSKMVAAQAIRYVGVFYLTWLAGTINRLVQLFSGRDIFVLMVLHSIFTPMQGFFNFLVYVYPQYKAYREGRARPPSSSLEVATSGKNFSARRQSTNSRNNNSQNQSQRRRSSFLVNSLQTTTPLASMNSRFQRSNSISRTSSRGAERSESFMEPVENVANNQLSSLADTSSNVPWKDDDDDKSDHPSNSSTDGKNVTIREDLLSVIGEESGSFAKNSIATRTSQLNSNDFEIDDDEGMVRLSISSLQSPPPTQSDEKSLSVHHESLPPRIMEEDVDTTTLISTTT